MKNENKMIDNRKFTFLMVSYDTPDIVNEIQKKINHDDLFIY